jgi:hypothetical protein
MKWTICEVEIKSIKPNPRNPRQISTRQSQLLSNLMDKYGLIDKPILNLDMTLIGGHQRIRILKKKRIKKVECWIAERQLEQHELDELCIGLNKNQGEFDYDILANNYEITDLMTWGFDEKELLDICDSQEAEEEEEKSKKQKECPHCGKSLK